MIVEDCVITRGVVDLDANRVGERKVAGRAAPNVVTQNRVRIRAQPGNPDTGSQIATDDVPLGCRRSTDRIALRSSSDYDS